MSSGSDGGSESPLGPADERRLRELRGASSLADLVEITGAPEEREAYFQAKREWSTLQKRSRTPTPHDGTLPGYRVVVGDAEIHVHGITHADTEPERRYLQERVPTLIDAGARVYCEQGIRSMYFEPLPAVCEMDDYHWAMDRCSALPTDTQFGSLSISEFDGLRGDIDSLRAQFREGVFRIIDSGGGIYGERFQKALGDVASDFLLGREHLATGNDYEAFRKSRAAANDPGKLADLQAYYRKSFLPQPVEREWLRLHNPKLEIVTHARNERMADYAVYHSDDVDRMHLVVGAAHQPGVAYYLRRHRDGHRNLAGFELLG